MGMGGFSWEEAPPPPSLSPGGLPRGGLSGGGEEEGGREGEGAVGGGGPPGSPRGDASGTGRGVVLPTFLSYSNVFVWFNNSQIWLIK